MTEQQLKKGLFRLWIVVSVCWIVAWTIGLNSFNAFEHDLIEALSYLLLPPVLLPIFSKSIFWVVKGFKKSD